MKKRRDRCADRIAPSRSLAATRPASAFCIGLPAFCRPISLCTSGIGMCICFLCCEEMPVTLAAAQRAFIIFLAVEDIVAGPANSVCIRSATVPIFHGPKWPCNSQIHWGTPPQPRVLQRTHARCDSSGWGITRDHHSFSSSSKAQLCFLRGGCTTLFDSISFTSCFKRMGNW